MRIPKTAATCAIPALAFAIGPTGAQVRVGPGVGPGLGGNHGVVLPTQAPTVAPTLSPTLNPTLTPTLTPSGLPQPNNPTVSSGGGGAQVPPGEDGAESYGDDGLYLALADAVDRDRVIEGVPLVKKRRLLLGDE